MSQINRHNRQQSQEFEVEAQAIAQLLYLKDVMEAEHDAEAYSQNIDAQEAWQFANDNDYQ